MKSLFPGYFKEKDTVRSDTWKKCIFVFDTNILLNLYRYSDTTRKEFIEVLETLKDRIWIPHRVAEEYLKNRLEVIHTQKISYSNTIKSINDLNNNLSNNRQHPFVSTKTMKQLDETFKSLNDELDKGIKDHSDRITNDEIMESIGTLFDNKVGPLYEKKQLEEIIKDGEYRYLEKIPPGYKDNNKHPKTSLFKEMCMRFGDLIIWNQILDYSRETDKDVILVSDDKKDDWWEGCHGKTIGPRPELIQEFKSRTGNSFHMYQSDSFLELAKDLLGKKYSNNTLKEIKGVRERLSEHKPVDRNELDNMLNSLDIDENLKHKIETLKLDLDSDILHYIHLSEKTNYLNSNIQEKLQGNTFEFLDLEPDKYELLNQQLESLIDKKKAVQIVMQNKRDYLNKLLRDIE